MYVEVPISTARQPVKSCIPPGAGPQHNMQAALYVMFFQICPEMSLLLLQAH
jgi:hypothetical protein